MEALDRIRKAHIKIMQHKKACVYAGILACGKVEVTTEVPTAATNGWDVKYNPEFVKKFLSTDEELRFVVLHEATHKAYRHLHTWQDLHEEDPHLANVAADHFVNLALLDMDDGEGFIKMPSVGIQPDPKYRGWSVKQIFEDLKQQQEEGGQGGGEDGFDSHDWADATSGDEQAQKEAEARGQEIARAIRQGEILRRKLAGKGSGVADGVFGDLLAPKVDWRKALREFVQEMCQGRDESSWRRPNRRYLSDDIYMPSMQGITMTELAVIFDTSGSCFGTAEMTRFVSEISALIEQVKPAKTHVLYVDTQVVGHQPFEDGQFAVQDLKPQGGGGTDLPVAFNWLREQRITPTAMVIFTDGYTPFGSAPPYPVLWAMSTDTMAPYGTTIHIDI